MAAQKSPVWSSNEWTGGENASSLEYYEHNVENLALEVVGQHWSSEVISLSLEDWEVSMGFHAKKEGCVSGELRVAGFP